MSEGKSVNVSIEIRKDKLIPLAVALLGFIFIFLKWIKVTVSLFGFSSSESVGILEGDMFDFSTLCGLAKVLLIIAIVVFVVYVVSCFINLGKLIPALNKVNLDRIIPIAYFGLYALALVFTLIGVLTVEVPYSAATCSPAVGWYLGLIMTIAGMVLMFVPNLLKNINDTIFKK